MIKSVLGQPETIPSVSTGTMTAVKRTDTGHQIGNGEYDLFVKVTYELVRTRR